jgi:HlyD family secretion protein
MSTHGPSFDSGSRLVSFFENLLARLRGRRVVSRPTSSPPPVIPVQVDLVGDGKPRQTASIGASSRRPSAAAPRREPAAAAASPLSASSSPFRSSLAVSSPNGIQRSWQFQQPVVLRRTGRSSGVLVWTAVGTVGVLGLWAVTAPLSETIAVQGKLEPSSKVKEVESPVPGVVEAVLVKEGQEVRQGEPLLRFDLREPRSRLATAESVRQRLLNEIRIAQATLGEPSATAGLTENQRRQLVEQATQRQSRLESARQELRKSETRLAGLQQSLATYANIAARYESLARAGAVSEVQLLENRNRVNEIQSDIREEEREIVRLRSEVLNADSTSGVELRSTIEANLRQISELDQQITQARQQLQYGELTAPSDGIVFDLEVARGSVVAANADKPLVKVVPQDALQARVYLPNRSIGFVRVGQPVELSIDTFEASRYGYVPAVVQRIGSDALTPEEQAQVLGTQAEGLHYPAVLRLEQQGIQLNRKAVPLQAGMTLTADIKLRDRRFINIFTNLFEDQKRNLERLR